MKKLMKICLWICGICIILGILLVAIAVSVFRVTSADWSGNVRNSFIKMDERLNQFEPELSAWREEHHETVEHELVAASDDIHAIEIDLKHGYITVEPSKTDKIEVKTGFAHKKIEIEQDGATIRIRDKRNSQNNIQKGAVAIYLPENMSLDAMKMNIDAGEFESEHPITLKNLSINSGAGEVDIESWTITECLDAKIGAGEMRLEKVDIQDMNVKTGAGNVELEGIVRGDVDAKCGMGNISLELDPDECPLNAINYSIACELGNITIGENEFGGMSNKQTIDNGGKQQFDLQCGIGNIEIE